MKTAPDLAFIPLPDPVQENEANLTPQWSAERTRLAIERPAKLMGMTPKEYWRQALAAVIARQRRGDVVTRDGQLACRELLSLSKSK